MKIDQWLIINSRGNCTLRTNKPAMRVNEISVRLHLEVPDALFVRPTIQASVILPEIAPIDLQADVYNNIVDAVKKATDLEVMVTLVPMTELDNE